MRLYDRRAMVRRSRGRYLAPIALAATITGTYLIVHNGLTHKSSTASSHVTRQPPPAAKHRRTVDKAKFYVVKPGDTLSSIAQKTGVSVGTLESLNPKVVNPNSLQTAQRLRLRR
jgi:LysM repeat protein